MTATDAPGFSASSHDESGPMDHGPERRRFERYRVPVEIVAPDMADAPVVPEDVCAGGFRVVVSRRLEVGNSFFCTIQTAEEVFPSTAVEVIWLKEVEGTPRRWSAGLAIKSADVNNARMDELLCELSRKLGGMMSPFP